MAINYLDGRRFRNALVAGADWVRFNREYINNINVFPVPDGDTGTNMALSLSATAAAVRASQSRELDLISRHAAEACIINAKGNSGTIMAHWFLGMSNAFADKKRVDCTRVASALQQATDEVYAGIEVPVEGTVVTVMRAVSDFALGWNRGGDLAEFMSELLRAGREALQRTPDQLAVLKAAKVVDAGAQGYVHFLEGAVRAVRGESPPSLREEDIDSMVDHSAIDHDPHNIQERFCTEVVVRGKGFNSERLRRLFRPYGDSLMVATTGSVFKLHIHTNVPDTILKLAGSQGTVEERKVDDMIRQAQEHGHVRDKALVSLPDQPPGVAVICDSTADLPLELRRELGIETASLQVLFGDKVFRDQVDISTPEFYEKLNTDPHHPTTSQPPPREFVEALEKIRDDREALVLTISSHLSGTYKSAMNALPLVNHPRVEVFDSDNVSAGLGMLVRNAARYAQQGASMDEILHWLSIWKADSGLLLSVATLEYLRRGGRIGAASSLIGGLLGLVPILSFSNGTIRPLAKARGREGAMRKVLQLLDETFEEGTRVRLGYVNVGDSQGSLERLEEHMRQRLNVVESLYGAPTGVVGAHAGPGAWGVFYQRVRDNDPLLETT